jgi:hypothetical protein
MSFTPTQQIRVWACAEPTSMRKSFDGLHAVVRNQMGREPLDGDITRTVPNITCSWKVFNSMVTATSSKFCGGSVPPGARLRCYSRNSDVAGMRCLERSF